MIRPTLVLLALAPGLALFAPEREPALERQAVDELEALVREEVRRATESPTESLWGRAVQLRDAAILGEDGDLDRVLDAELGRGEELSPNAVLLLAACRLQGTDPDPTTLATALQPLIELEDSLAIGAAQLLGDPTLRDLGRSRKQGLVTIMLSAAENTDRSPEYRLAYAEASYVIGGGSERRKANKVMKTFLESEDADLRAQGALALAELDGMALEGRLREVLEGLSRVPDSRGDLAKSYLKREEIYEYSERRVRELREKMNDNELPLDVRKFLSVRDMIQREHLEGGNAIDAEKLTNAAINGMLQWMDPHSSYFSPEAYAKFFQDLEAEYGGIGAYVNEDPDDRIFTIVRPIYSGPAYRAGLLTDDKIVRIDDWPTLGQSTDDIIKRLKGKPGTPVELYIWRRGMDPELIDRPTEDMIVTVNREQVTIPAGTYQLLPGGIGLVQLTTFSHASMRSIREWIPKMQADGMRALIFDLRFNSGGLLTEAREVADLFLPPGKVVVSTAGRDRPTETLKTRTEPLLDMEVPIVVLTGRQTASAAEIVSGALQDHGRATLVGKTTFGKGSVQQLMPLMREELEDRWIDENRNYIRDPWEKITEDRDGDGEMTYAPRVKLTIARYLLPSGRSIHRELDKEGNILAPGGVEPDEIVDTPLIERWRFEEQRRILPAVREYVMKHFPENHELFGRLAVNDQKNPDYYPEFDQLMVDLGTTVSRDDVRRLVRAEVRLRVQDDRGQEFPAGDYEEDPQVQRAIQIALTQLGENVEDVTEYGLVFDTPETASLAGTGSLASGSGNPQSEIRRARNLLERARGGSVLSEADVDELLSLIGTIEKSDHN